MTATQWRHGDYTISTDKTKLDLRVIHGFLTKSYWAKGIPYEVVAKAIEHSLNFGLFKAKEQIGLARAITDYATFMYLADVFVLEPHRGQGLGVWLVDTTLKHPDLQGIRTWMLLTSDAHELYRKFDFEVPDNPKKIMQRKVTYPYAEH